MNIHSDFGTFVCQVCQLVFNEKSQYLIHLRGHDEKKLTESKYDTSVRIFVLRYFNNMKIIFFFFCSRLRKFKCEMCSSCFENRMELRQHELDVHSIVPNLEELKPFACLYCDKRFTTRGKCNLHMETHSDVSAYFMRFGTSPFE